MRKRYFLVEAFFWNELKDRIEGKNAKDAAIEVNYWCAEEATYHSGDDRTLPALTVYQKRLRTLR